MSSPYCERAIEDAIENGNAILKFISANDVDLTGGHQYGFLLPKPVWQMYTVHPPEKGVNAETEVRVLWQDGRVTKSCIHWYGKDTRSEYRLTRFGRDFPFRTFDNFGDLLVLIPRSYTEFIAYVLYDDEDIEDIQTTLGVEIVGTWTAYQDGVPQVETEDDCIDKLFRKFAESVTEFPPGIVFSDQARRVLKDCVKHFASWSPDDMLTASIQAEYQLFQLVERQICTAEVVRMKRDVDDFLKTAASIMNRRKSRAGRALENHVEYLLKEASIPHEMRPRIDGRPDVVIPSKAAYYDSAFPLEKLFIVGIKMTCKDRWRQVLNEGKRVPEKHILTLQPGISDNQLNEMDEAGVTLIVPDDLRKEYTKKQKARINILNIEGFITTVRERLE